MDKPRKQSTCDRKGVQSLFIPAVPQIVLNANEQAELNTGSNSMPHSRSAGELAMCMSSGSSAPTTPGSVIICNGSEVSSSRTNIDIYCSPRLPRKGYPYATAIDHYSEDTQWMESTDSTFPNKLSSGSRAGSALSLASEYTARSVGLISNDSSSDSTQFSDKLEHIKQKQNLLRRYASNPEKPPSESPDVSVPRCTKSVNNLHNKCTPPHYYCNALDQESDSQSDEFPDISMSEINRQLNMKLKSQDGDEYSPNLVTMVTDELSLKEGRVRAWLTDIGAPNTD